MLAAVALLLFSYADADAIPTNLKPGDQSTVEGTIQLGIRLLEAGKHQELVEKLAHPEDLKEMLEREGGMEKIVAEFKDGNSDELLVVLQAIDPAQLEYNEARDEAKIKLPPDLPGPGKIKFAKFQGKWHIRD